VILISLVYEDLVKDVLEKLNSREKDIRVRDGRAFRVRILPYRTVENVIDGVVLTFMEIANQVRANKSKKES